MPTTKSLIKQLRVDFPGVIFELSDDFYYSPQNQTVFYSSGNMARLLHELGHALLEHSNYSRDIDLLKIERQAWDKARTLSLDYGMTITDDTIQDDLDSYRLWLHKRSLCPECSANGLQTSLDTYRCLSCRTDWRVNEAITCGLKRYQLKTPA